MTDAPADRSVDSLRAALDRVLPGTRADLEELVRIPSVSADPSHRDDVARAAARVEQLARDAGAAQAQVVSVDGGGPAVVASWPAPAGAPTVLLYAHLDVQPTGPVDDWTAEPFEPTERDGRLYGRGAADDKAGVAMHLAVLRAYDGQPPVGVVLFVEGEEEVGSPSLTALLAQHGELLRADVIVIADSSNAAVDVPALTTSLRGLVEVYATVRLLERPVHSGMFGGPVVDALTVLCRMLATLHDDRGDVAVAGLTTSRSAAPDLDPADFAADAGLVEGAELVGSGTLAERLWHRPAVAVVGLDATPVSAASNVLLARAGAKVSMRIAPGDDPDRAYEALASHLRAAVPWGAEVELTRGAVGAPFALEASGRVYDVAREAFAQAYGNPAVETGVGGSIPFIAELVRTYPGATVLVTGVGDPASRWHGIDESLHLGMWERACLGEALLLAGLARPS